MADSRDKEKEINLHKQGKSTFDEKNTDDIKYGNNDKVKKNHFEERHSAVISHHPFEVKSLPGSNDTTPVTEIMTSPTPLSPVPHISNYPPEDEFIRQLKGHNGGKFLSSLSGGFHDTEMHAMSMASLYDKHDMKAMDAGGDKESTAGRSYCSSFKVDLCTEEEADISEDSENEMLANSSDNNSNEKCQYSNYSNGDNNNTFNRPDVPKGCCYAPPNPFDENASINNSLLFSDGLRSVDFVLAWQPDLNDSVERTHQDKRAVFEMNLVNQGLELEEDNIGGDMYFVKIHAPLEVLRRYAEILKLRMPMKEIPGLRGVKTTTNTVYSRLKTAWEYFSKKVLFDEKNFPKRSQRFTAIYSRDKEYLFDLQQDCFFTPSVRSRIVQFILDRQRFSPGNTDDFAFGIDRLVSERAYLAAYPLHDGEINVPGSMRNRLYTEWAAIRKWYRYQPLDYIKEYFGVKIGLYFAWLGYYTYMLLLASIVGIICFIYSYATLRKDILSNDICSSKLNVKMCPLCDHWCDYWDLKDTCFHARVTYLIDNPTTVFFAVFMSFWATLFLELWKRYSAEITHRWDLTGFDIREEHPRPQYLARLAHVKKIRVDYVTNTKEPQPPFWRMKVPATVFSFSVILLLIMMAFAAVLAVVLYRMSMMAVLAVRGTEVSTSGALFITTATAACINLCLIFIFNYMYTYLAEYLTELELLRTQTEFDDSLTLKIYLLQFVNYYASIFYIAFFKGKFVGHPGKYVRFLEYRQEECGFGGCLMELCIQLSIIMVGKQAMNTVLEMLIPQFWRWVNVMRVRFFNRNKNFSFKGKGERWLRDLKLVEWGPRSLFPEYLEMVLQYGFVTIFVAAFPLAPLFALLNNILEMRLDAKKLLTFYRRPVSQRVKDIGVWYRILDSIAKLSVITNGFIIAFTSNFIPRLVYQLYISENGSMDNYLNYSLAYFNTSHFDSPMWRSSNSNITICRYPDLREPPWSENRYERTTMYYVILACRLAFVVIFENLVALVMILVHWCIPDMKADLRDQIRREAYITNEIVIRQETLRDRAERFERQFSEPVEPNVNFIRMEKLMSGKLTQYELDLLMNAPGDPTAPGISSSQNENRRRDCSNYDVSHGESSVITTDVADTGPVPV